MFRFPPHSMSRRRRPLAWLVGFVALASAAPALATTLIALDEEQLVAESSQIVTGFCTGIRHEWRDGTLLTLATVRIDRVLKGTPAAEVTVVLPGGVDFERQVPVAVTFPGAPTLLPSERVLLFLGPADTSRGELAITGFSQGKLSILEAADGTPMVRRDLSGLSLVKGNRLRAGGRHAEPLSVIEERIFRRVESLSRKGGER